jgi:hypothetical protein
MVQYRFELRDESRISNRTGTNREDASGLFSLPCLGIAPGTPNSVGSLGNNNEMDKNFLLCPLEIFAIYRRTVVIV